MALNFFLVNHKKINSQLSYFWCVKICLNVSSELNVQSLMTYAEKDFFFFFVEDLLNVRFAI